MSNTLWYSGVDDVVLEKVAAWKRAWPYGKSHSTRSAMTMQGAVDITTKRIVPIVWRPEEWQEIVRLLQAVKPKWQLTKDCEDIGRSLHKYRLLPGGGRLIEFSVYSKDVEEIYDALLEAKQGKSELQELFERTPEGNKDLWA